METIDGWAIRFPAGQSGHIPLSTAGRRAALLNFTVRRHGQAKPSTNLLHTGAPGPPVPEMNLALVTTFKLGRL
jgi:hypothetical protein